jgi:drug/metabolite transporter (DMT)-like permease
MVFLTLLAVVVLRESFHRAHALSIFTILGGIIIIALRGFTDGIELSVGDFIVVVSCLCYATGGIVFRKFLPHADPNIVILTRSMVGMTAFFLLSPFVSHPLVAEIAAFPLQVLPVLLGFAFISRFLNLFSFYEAMERLPVTTVSLCLNLPVIGSILFSAWFLGESVELYHFVGGAFIIAGALMLEMAGMHPSEQHLDKHLRHGNMRSPT